MPRSTSHRQTLLGPALACLPLVVAMAVLAFLSDGGHMEDDLTHFLHARWAWNEPLYFLDDWGRPGFTIPYALVAWVGTPETGWLCTRLLTVVIAAMSAALAAGVARELGRGLDASFRSNLRQSDENATPGSRLPRAGFADRAWIAAPLLLLMTFYFRLAYTTLTETICGFYLILGTWCLAKNRTRSAAIIFGLTMMTRHETAVLVVWAACYFAWRRDWIALLLLGAVELVWNVLSAACFDKFPLLRFIVPTGAEIYGEGTSTLYLVWWAKVASPTGMVLSVAGMTVAVVAAFGALRRRAGSPRFDPVARRTVLATWVAGGALLAILTQTALYWHNAFASGGYPRYLVSTCPWLAVLAAWGLNPLLGSLPGRTDDSSAGTPRRLAAAGVLVGLLLWAVAIVAEFSNPLTRARYELTSFNLACSGVFILLVGLIASVIIFSDRFFVRVGFVTLTLSWMIGKWAWEAAPWKQGSFEHEIRAAVTDARTRFGPDVTLLGASPWVMYFDSRPWSAHMPSPEQFRSDASVGHRWARQDVFAFAWPLWRDAPPGTLFVWEPNQASYRLPSDWPRHVDSELVWSGTDEFEGRGAVRVWRKRSASTTASGEAAE